MFKKLRVPVVWCRYKEKVCFLVWDVSQHTRVYSGQSKRTGECVSCVLREGTVRTTPPHTHAHI